MTREEAVTEYMNVVSAVFKAEKALHDKWNPRLAEAKFHSKQEQEKVAQDYLYAIAEEIVSKTTDEELAKL